MREDGARTALLFKPAAQIALVDALLRASDNGDLKIAEAIERANRIQSWSMGDPVWRGVIIKTSGAIDAGQEARRRMAALVCYMVAADRISEELKFVTWKLLNEARDKDVEAWLASGGTEGEMEDLPQPVEGNPFAVDDARAYAEQVGELKA